MSITVTTKLHEPPPVEDETLTVVGPTGKNVPEAGEVCIVPQSPEVSMLPAKFTTAPGAPF